MRWRATHRSDAQHEAPARLVRSAGLNKHFFFGTRFELRLEAIGHEIGVGGSTAVDEGASPPRVRDPPDSLDFCSLPKARFGRGYLNSSPEASKPIRIYVYGAIVLYPNGA